MLTALLAVAAFGVGVYLGTKLEERRPTWNNQMEQHLERAVSAAVREVREGMRD